MSKLTRRAVLRLVAGASAATLLPACNGKDPPADAPGIDAPAGCGLTDASVMIMFNHSHAPHELVVSSADVQAGVEKTYTIKGAANHMHTLTITAEQFAMLQAGGTIMATTSREVDHEHVITVSCG